MSNISEDKDFELDSNRIRRHFPLINNRNIAYLDNGATTQKPMQVLEAMNNYYENNNANPFRGVYELSVDATDAYERARARVAKFINAKTEEIVFTRNASESINLVAYSLGIKGISEGDEIVVSIAEHHSNFLPWLQVAKRTGAKVVFWECDEEGNFDIETLKSLVNEKTKLVAITQVSNVIGKINDVKSFAKVARSVGAKILVDGAQSVPHMPVDVKDLDCDFLVFSGHKMLSPMGIGVLYGKLEHLEEMDPFLYGGEMIETVTRTGATYAEVPHKFEAGTVNVGDAVGLEAAIDYIDTIGFDTIMKRERALTQYAFELIRDIEGIEIIGSQEATEHEGIITFRVKGVHPHDVASIFDTKGVAVRAGHHCAQPLLQHLYDLKDEKPTGGISTTRVSISFYNNVEDIERFAKALSEIRGEMGYE